MLNRRRFLQQSSLVSLAPLLPAFLPRSLFAAPPDVDGRILVVIQLDGGNDGLNTVVPFADENYIKARATLKVAEKDVLKLDERLGLNPGMKGAAELAEKGRLAIVQGVSYPNPNRSHFESMSIWQHARLADSEHDSIGWLGRTCDGNRRTDGSPDSIFLGKDELPVALRGRRAVPVSLDTEADLQLTLSPSPSAASAKDADVSVYIQRTVSDSYVAARRFQETAPAKGDSATKYPTSKLGKHLQLVSRMIKSGYSTRLYYASQSGYDTHSAQQYPHRQLLSEFSSSVSAFLKDLEDAKLDDRVVVLTFSEFGRRVQENDSAGTDHGAAGPVFIAGKPVKGGLHGGHPSLTDLDDGDLKMQFDFRQVYATLLDRWLGVESKSVLNGVFESLPFI